MNLYLAGQRLNEVLGELSLSKSRGEAAATLSAVILTAAADTLFPGLTLALGDGVTLADDSGTRFSGGVQEVRRTPETVSFTAYDRGIYLTRNELYGVFSGSGADIAAQVAGALGIALGAVDAPTGFQTIVTSSGDTAYDILRRAVGEDREIAVEGERLCIGGGDEAPVSLAREHLLAVESVGSIGDMVNRAVVLKRGTVTPLAQAQDDAAMAAYGQFQTARALSGDNAQAQAAAALRGPACTARLTVQGDLALRCGGRVELSAPEWGLEGTFSITGVEHRWKAGMFTSALALERESGGIG